MGGECFEKGECYVHIVLHCLICLNFVFLSKSIVRWYGFVVAVLFVVFFISNCIWWFLFAHTHTFTYNVRARGGNFVMQFFPIESLQLLCTHTDASAWVIESKSTMMLKITFQFDTRIVEEFQILRYMEFSGEASKSGNDGKV